MAKDNKSGKGNRSSKTARVLSLLTDPETVEDTHGEAPAEGSAGKNGKHGDADTQAQIRSALESELAELAPLPDFSAEPLPESAPQPAPAPAAEPPKPQPAPAPVAEPPKPRPAPAPVAEPPKPQPAPAPVAEPPKPRPAPAPAAEPPKPQPAPAPAVEQPKPQQEPDPVKDPEVDEYVCLNVTEALVEEKADKYIKMFGMCSCSRCRIDVIAMALSNLPAKYVVVKGSEINPRLSFYEAKYNSAVITQVMGACKKVHERPHHER